jgi:hypothetical protein
LEEKWDTVDPVKWNRASRIYGYRISVKIIPATSDEEANPITESQNSSDYYLRERLLQSRCKAITAQAADELTIRLMMWSRMSDSSISIVREEAYFEDAVLIWIV